MADHPTDGGDRCAAMSLPIRFRCALSSSVEKMGFGLSVVIAASAPATTFLFLASSLAFAAAIPVPKPAVDAPPWPQLRPI